MRLRILLIGLTLCLAVESSAYDVSREPGRKTITFESRGDIEKALNKGAIDKVEYEAVMARVESDQLLTPPSKWWAVADFVSYIGFMEIGAEAVGYCTGYLAFILGKSLALSIVSKPGGRQQLLQPLIDRGENVDNIANERIVFAYTLAIVTKGVSIGETIGRALGGFFGVGYFSKARRPADELRFNMTYNVDGSLRELLSLDAQGEVGLRLEADYEI